MADGSTAPAGEPEPAYGLLPPKSLEKLFGVDTILRNPDDPTDGVFEVIKDKKGNILCIRKEYKGGSKRWLRYEKGTVQRLVDDAQNAVAVDVPTLLPDATLLPWPPPGFCGPFPAHWPRIEPRTSGRKRKSVDDVGDVGENAVAVDVPTLLPVRIEPRTSGRKRKSVDYSEQNDVGDVGETAEVVKKTAEVVKKTAGVVEKTASAVKKTAVDRVQQKKDARKRWRVAGTVLRFSTRLRKQEASSHTGLSLDFDAMDV